ncbi:MAG: DNA-3-methyladenine glycosylase, partial [Gemmatimonadales bacterium]
AGMALMRRRRHGVAEGALCAGPARLCEALGVTGVLDGVALQRRPLRILRNPARGRLLVGSGPRIGVSRAADWPLRFFVRESPWLSR